MTAVEMQYSFEIKFGVFHGLNKPFTSADIAGFLNKAQEDFVVSRYASIPGSPAYFEKNEKTRMELGTLIKEAVILRASFASNSAKNDDFDSSFVDLPTDMLYAISEKCGVRYTNCNGALTVTEAKVLPMRHDEIEVNFDNPFRKPYEKLIWRIDYGALDRKQHELICSNQNEIQSYRIRYLKIPQKIDIITGVNSELHVSIHEEIVDRAVIIALAAIPKTQSINQNQET